MPIPPRSRPSRGLSVRSIALVAGAFYYVAALVIFRDVLFAIPSVLRGETVIVGDELVPFFNWHTQLLDQAAGQFNDLVHGYEFRVRYAFLTTWLRFYPVLPFAILLVIPTLFWVTYLTVARFIERVFTALSPQAIYLATFFPVALIYLIMVYSKITHFYTLILGLVMMTMSALWMLYALLFAGRAWKRYMVIACLATLLNPAIHYLILFSLFFGLTIVTLLVGELANWIRRGGPARLRTLPARVRGFMTDGGRWPRLRRAFARWSATTSGRVVLAFAMYVAITLVPYALFVKYVALAGVSNLTDTVPGDFYFIQDASVSWLHMFSWDLAGITDKILFGDYLAKVPRYPDAAYTLLLVVPLLVPAVRRRLFRTRPHRQLLGVIAVAIVFALWATIGYGEPLWFPTFHRTLAALATTANESNSAIGDLLVTAAGTVVQILRFPHRFQLILFMLAPLVMSLTLAYLIDVVSGRWLRRSAHRSTGEVLIKLLATVSVGAVFFTPFWSNDPYRTVFASGNMAGFLSPFPLQDLKDLKRAIKELPEGKTVVIPPTETAKLVGDSNGVDHKFIDKFFIYYLDKPSYYYGLTGDVQNKFDFFLILRGLYYRQDWWINVARDINVKYIVVNRRIHSNGGIGAEYLPNVESFVEPGLARLSDDIALRFENDSYALYEITDLPSGPRDTILVDSSWQSYLDLVFSRRNLSRCYTFEFTPYVDLAAARAGPPIKLLTDDEPTSALDLYLLEHPEAISGPDTRMFAFNPDVVASNYYLSPMFRSFLLFSNTKWNRMGMITPGVFGTLRGSFVGLPRDTEIAIPVDIAESGRYRVLMRTANTANTVQVTAPSLGFDETFELRSPPENVKFYPVDDVYDTDRVAVDASGMSVSEIEDAVPEELVAVNFGYSYQDLGVVDADAGTHTFSLQKTDQNPMLFEGMMLVPDDVYQTLELPTDVVPITDPNELDCSERTESSGPDDGYVDAAANPEHANLTQDELLNLAAADVGDLEPPAGGVVGSSWIGVGVTVLILLMSGLIVRWRSRSRPDDPAPDDPAPDDPPSDDDDDDKEPTS
ncbi:hypothetical protein [Homoserinibacter sp. GY 40078]|uniref:hypothetical protein n=1 Tax=Homoserinibacter sp. GY 40078 TaxID=2603275 RepID=UPI0011C71550|nr:hypothetical protein [Homoserinibacter sp. GY 40078]TXK17261.1 hypothetical protein FVQ89_10430 [Homoserinibacter sp. GY 40078]